MVRHVVAFGGDHGGILIKDTLITHLKSIGHDVIDCGPVGSDPVDYPDFAYRVAAVMHKGEADRGLVVCGTGIGMSIAINRYSWIRAALCHDVTSARLSREHNDANVLALGARMTGLEVAKDSLTAFLKTDFLEGRHTQRVRKLGSPPEFNGRTDAA